MAGKSKGRVEYSSEQSRHPGFPEGIYKTIVESCNDGVVILQDGLIEYTNPKILKMTGYSLEQTLGTHFLDFISPDDREYVAENYRKRISGEEADDRYDVSLLSRDGHDINVECHASLITYRGSPGDMVVMRDQTERKREEKELKGSRSFLASIIEQTPHAIWISDAEGNVIRTNKALRDMLQIPDEQIIGQYNVLQDTQVKEQGFMPLVERVFFKGETARFIIDYHTQAEKQLTAETDTHKYLDIIMSPVRYEESNNHYVLCQQMDITETIEAEKALEQSEEKYRSLYVNSYNAVLMTIPNGRILAANPAACRMFSRTEDEIIEAGRNGLVDLTDPRLTIALEQREKERYYRGQLRLLRKDGSGFEAEVTSVVYQDSDGNPRTCMVIQDISEREEHHHLIQKTNRTLRVLNQCNQALVHSTEETVLLEEISRIIIEEGGYRFTWVGYKEHDRRKTVKPIAVKGIENGYLEKTDIRWSDTTYGNGPTGTAIRSGKVCIIEDTLTDERFKPWRKEAVLRGYSAVISLPLCNNDEVFGALTIYAGEAGAFTREEIHLLTELANDLSFGIVTLRSRKFREETERLVRENERRLVDALDLGKMVSWEYDIDTQLVTWDDQTYILFERDPDLDAPKHGEQTGLYTPEQEKLLYEYGERAINDKEEMSFDMDVFSPDGHIKHFTNKIRPVIDHGGNVTKLFGIVQDISERKKSEESLRLFDAALRSIHDGVFAMDDQFNIIYWNETCETIFGIKASDALDKQVADVLAMVEEYPGQNQERVSDLLEHGYNRSEQQYQTPNGIVWVDIIAQAIERDGTRYGWITIATDINEPKLAEKRQRLMVDILQVLNQSEGRNEIMGLLLYMIKEYAGLEGVGIRLHDGSDYPYVAINGLTDTQVTSGNSLCRFDTGGKVLTDENGAPLLECMCGRILQGRYTPESPFYTEGGSFWTNSVTDLFETSKEDADVLFSKDGCLTAGYESLALVPVRSGNRVIGLIQLSDSRRDIFNAEMIRFFESIGDSIGIAFNRSLAQEELKHEKEHIENILNTAQTIILTLDNEGRIIDFNPYMEDLTGYRIDEVRGESWFETFIPERYRNAVRNLFSLSINNVPTIGNVNPIITRNGKERQIVWYDTTITNEDGSEILLSTGQDITERLQAEQTLRSILESIPQGVILTDLQGIITQVNRSALLLYELGSPDDIIGRNTLDFSIHEDHVKIVENVRSAFEEDKQETFVYTALTSRGKSFAAEMSVAAVRNASGQATGMIGVIEDITERQKIQEKLIVTDRLASVGELAAGIAHELNNPLTGVVGFSDLLLGRNDIPEDIHNDVQIINREALRASNVARNLLTFARRHPNEKSRVNINDIINIVLELRSYEQQVSNITVRRHLDNTLPLIMANEFQIQQVLLNIVINAEYFMKEEHGQGILTITSECATDAVRIVIEDDGPGIPADSLPHIFNPFYTTKPVGKGTGLGLSICYGIIKEHNGELFAESEYGKGTRFIIEFTVPEEKADV